MTVIESSIQSGAHDAPRLPESYFESGTMCDESERRQDSEPAIFPSLLFTEEEVNAVNWDAVFTKW